MHLCLIIRGSVSTNSNCNTSHKKVPVLCSRPTYVVKLHSPIASTESQYISFTPCPLSPARDCHSYLDRKPEAILRAPREPELKPPCAYLTM